MRNKIILIALSLGIGLVSSCNNFSRIMRSPDQDERYDAALMYYENEDYYRAGLLFEDLIPNLIGSEKAENVQYYFAYCHYKQKQYSLAAHYFRSFYDTYRRSPKAEETLYMHAYSLYKSTPEYYLDQSHTDEAVTAMQDYLNRYPTAASKQEANDVIDELRAKLEVKDFQISKQYQKLSRFKSAVVSYDNFLKDFPDSEYKEEAIFRKMVSEYELARLSITDKRQQRYEAMIKDYVYFVDRYPESTFAKEAEKYFDNSQKELRAILAQEKAKAVEEEAAKNSLGANTTQTPAGADKL